ncbi:hypothetical protein [Flavobacterium sp.]|uniref:hypothetical protein n=1 Tax=Flavobacterium sp. TaxID=239 RepID=UPI0022BF8492|nr:hypothetical protein [Flavobacterium sp.]MCZ8091445.1 hypothetical protein [Flavobacterium sp.]
MKSSKITYIIFTIFFISCSENFNKLSEKSIDTEELLRNIQTSSKVQYWQLERVPNWKDENKNSEILFSKGIKIKVTEPSQNNRFDWNGFFRGCEPSFCAYQISYIKSNKWQTVKSEKELKEFIGKIDNESEAFLIGKINDYDIDYYSEKGNGFIKEKEGYKIRMMIYNSCPESKESFTLFINESGNIESTKSNGFYLKSKNCIVY